MAGNKRKQGMGSAADERDLREGVDTSQGRDQSLQE